MDKNKLIPFFIVLLIALLPLITSAQEVTKDLIIELKNDSRGPYKDIRWFCKDGSINDPKVPCGEIGGVQRARYKDVISSLAQKKHIFLGQILSATDYEDFWDKKNQQSRLKQYIIEQFLFNNDNGWIQQKSQYYRGATQVEDEEDWGRAFYDWIFTQVGISQDNYLLLRESARFIPHSGDQNILVRVRAYSKDLAEMYPKFNDWRIKIHGKPQTSDLTGVEKFKEEHQQNFSPQQIQKVDELLSEMRNLYTADDSEIIKLALAKIKKHATLSSKVNRYMVMLKQYEDVNAQMIQGVELLSDLKTAIINDRTEKLAMIDLFQAIESRMFLHMPEWVAADVWQQMEKGCHLAQWANAAGYINDYEWAEIEAELTSGIGEQVDYPTVLDVYQSLRKSVLWGGSMLQALYETEINRFSSFEPLTHGFIDDRIRSGVLLSLGETAASFQEYLAKSAKWHNDFFGQNISSIQGLNPGYSMGRLIIVESGDEFKGVEDASAIYVFQEPPADLDPVGGIISISEGNLVSHLQLLARNLGIPNASITSDIFDKMRRYDGELVFMAVSDKGGVVIKKENEMTEIEKQLFSKKERKEERIRVPTEDIVLDGPILYNLRDVRADASGSKCGPKAANLGELKYLFPDKVVEGLVLPFSVFKAHMDMTIPGRSESYWRYLLRTFEDPRSKDDAWTLVQLDTLRTLIKSMTLKPELITQLERDFSAVLGAEIGKVPVFLRSDTNMEDLPDFTGAGLNLTLFNVLDKEKIFQGIKDVWASPYTERSYKWRQKFLLNPENVYPSILIIPSVFVDYSGVIITKDVSGAKSNALTVAFSRGAGGAVEGQKAETRLLSGNGDHRLLSPARDFTYKSLSPKGGTETFMTSISKPILNPKNIKDIYELVLQVNKKMPAAGMFWPYDIELGFKDDVLWLFQIRPFVENKKALSSEYLQSINPEIPTELKFNTSDPFF